MNGPGTYKSSKVQDFLTLTVKSPEFDAEEMIPLRFSCEGANVNPALEIAHIPEETKSLAVIVDDPDAPNGNFTHWVAWNIPTTHQVREDEDRGVCGLNGYGFHRYDGPCPPSGTHRYYFKVYALDHSLDIPTNAGKKELEKAMAGHILAFGSLMGKYKRHKERE